VLSDRVISYQHAKTGVYSTHFDYGRFPFPTLSGNVTSAGWQVTLCDPMWHVSSRSGVAILRTAIHLLLTYFPSTLSALPSLPSPLEVGPHCGEGGLGECISSPSGFGQSPSAKRILLHFRHKFAPFDCLTTNNFPCLLSVKRKFP